MSLNSLIQGKLAGKRSEILAKYGKERGKISEAYRKSFESTVKKFKGELQDLVEKAHKAGVNLQIHNVWESNKPNRAEASLMDRSHDLPEIKKLNSDERDELKKFDALDERSQLAALLPAGKRREEMSDILEAISKF